MDPFTAAIDDLQAKIAEAMNEGTRRTVEMVLIEAHTMSSGPYSIASLARMGSPYAARDPRPPMDAGVINKQTGDFFRAWDSHVGSWNGSSISAKVFNDDWKADLLKGGTRYMIERPIEDRLEDYARSIFEDNLRNAIERIQL